MPRTRKSTADRPQGKNDHWVFDLPRKLTAVSAYLKLIGSCLTCQQAEKDALENRRQEDADY